MMTFCRTVLVPAVLVAVSALPASGQREGDTLPAPVASVAVEPEKHGNWRVSYRFDSPQKVLAFAHSSADYRSATWTLETDGAQFGRLNGVDVIVFDEPSSVASFSIIPLTGQLPDDQTPFVTFADGSIALFDAQFQLVPFKSLEGVKALEGDIAAAPAPALPLEVRIKSDTSLIGQAGRSEGSLSQTVTGSGHYIYAGNGDVESLDGLHLLIDERLPDWIAGNLGADIEGFVESLEKLWGYELSKPFTVIVAYKGAQADGLWLHGSSLDDQLLLELGGAGFSAPDSEALAYLHWYTIREIVQLFQTEKDVVLAGEEAAWIHDGAANSIAYQLIASDMPSSSSFLTSVYAGAFEDCVRALEGGTLESARERGAATGPYACGDFIARATDGFLKRRDLFSFWTMLTDWASRSSDGTLDKQVYFTTLQLLGATAGQREQIRAIVEDELPQPRESLKALLEAAGLNPQLSDTGQLIALDWPDYSPQ
jgi:hypothetical protein